MADDLSNETPASVPGAPASGASRTHPVTWVEQYGDQLYGYALLRVRSSAIAEDLVQDTFLAAWKSRASFAGRSTEKTWLVGILKYKILEHYRKVNRERPARSEPEADQGWDQFFDDWEHWKREAPIGPAEWDASPEACLTRKEFWEVLQHCLEELPPRTAEAFALLELEQVEAEKIREILNVSATNLYTILHRARMLLRVCLDKNWFRPAR